MPVDWAAPRAKVISLGCRLNLAEGEAIRRGLEAAGGDAIVVNTCGVTNEAVRRSRQTIRRLRRENPTARLFATGCAAQMDPTGFAAMEELTGVIGNDAKLKPETWSDILAAPADGEPILRVDDIMSVRETAPQLAPALGERARAFLQVQNGCDHRCTFCAIPFGRGPARSTPIVDVLRQARMLVAAGHDELVVTGVDITSWGADLDGRPALGDLIAALLDETPGLVRLRLSSIDGAEIDDVLFERIAGDRRLAPYLHLSVQSGDDMILKRMKRRHRRGDVIRLVEELRTRRPELAVGADMIAGFPTETAGMFANSLALVDDAGINYLHVFPFSPRRGTPAARMPQVDRLVVRQRAMQLREKGEAATRAFLDHLIGLKCEATIESGGVARLDNFAEVILTDPPAPVLIGRSRTVEIMDRKGLRLSGAIVADRPVAAE
ncbi:MAG: tRNA (N(6)-L-threonylcarbamoyladenosine(37)-C(2))-methylthiotransferase MtaB [Alphaproteobacteria bacterium]|nr:tRNA (N(6)-L-threonylcarbamoyladenosine(37)-C(2))-methylthiotransferase MtaB [Alphaproteobacteria bacterium]